MHDLMDLLRAAPALQLVLLALGAATSLVGNSLLSMAHCRRTRKKWSLLGNPFSEMVNYSRMEWVSFFAIVSVAMSFFAAALAVG